MIQLIVHKARKEHIGAYKEWGKKLDGEKKKEAAESIEKEGIHRESAFLVELEGIQYIAYLVQSEEEPEEADNSVSVNREHRNQNRIVLEPDTRATGTLLYDVQASDE